MKADRQVHVYKGYKHIPDELKKKPGRPRKYTDGYSERRYVSKKKLTQEEKQAVYIRLFGKPIVQLDYYTYEFVDEYPSISSFASDYFLENNCVSKALNRYQTPISFIHAEELAFMFKEDYEKLKGILQVK